MIGKSGKQASLVLKQHNKHNDWNIIIPFPVLGLPKPAVINQAKAVSASAFWHIFDFNENDIAYAVTPLYHSASFLISVYNTLDQGMFFVDEIC